MKADFLAGSQVENIKDSLQSSWEEMQNKDSYISASVSKLRLKLV